jgi:hypothetical protein
MILALSLGLNFTSAIFFSIVALPFIADAFVGLAVTVHNVRTPILSQLKEELLVNGCSPVTLKEESILPEEVQSLLNVAGKTEFVEVFCHESWKKDAFNKENAFELQISSGILIFCQIYISIMCAVESGMAPVFSIFVTLYALSSLYAYFRISDHVDAF